MPAVEGEYFISFFYSSLYCQCDEGLISHMTVSNAYKCSLQLDLNWDFSSPYQGHPIVEHAFSLDSYLPRCNRLVVLVGKSGRLHPVCIPSTFAAQQDVVK
jgi:hypothetical protein